MQNVRKSQISELKQNEDRSHFKDERQNLILNNEKSKNSNQ